MRKSRPLLSLLLAGVLTQPATACECLWQGAFIDVLAHADLVVSGRVTMRKGNAVDLDVDDVLRGQEFRDRVRIWGNPHPAGPGSPPDSTPRMSGDNGVTGLPEPGYDPAFDADCRVDVADIDPGSQWVMALRRIERLPSSGFNPATPNISYGRVDDYALSRCGVYWLRRDASFVSGNLLKAPRWQLSLIHI